MNTILKGIYWEKVNTATILLYFLIIIFLPINQHVSTIFLFALIALWSRLPGIGHSIIGTWLISLDFVDIFSMIIAINFGGLTGAVFSVILNLGSGFFSKDTFWFPIIKDAIAQFFVCLIIPFVYAISGNIIITMTSYTLLRTLMFFPMQLFPSDLNFQQFIVTITGWTIILLIVNNFYAAIFGNFFNSLFESEVKFSWILFLFVSLVIVSSKVYLYLKNHSKKNEIDLYNY